MSEALKPYLKRSFAVHGAVVAAFLLFGPRSGLKPASVYMIDFVGGAPVIASAGAAAAAAAAAAKPAPIAPQADPDAVRTHGRRGPVALPRPSLLHGGKQAEMLPAPETSIAGQALKPATMGPAAGEVHAPVGGAGAAAAGAGVSTDLPNFPYPWYISQVRLMLWQAWQKRMPRLDAEGAVGFAILRNGAITDLSVESSSGDPDFDRAALESVSAAVPFPALPADFREPFLKIHLALKSEEAWR